MQNSKNISRREFIKLVGAGLAAIGLPNWLPNYTTAEGSYRYARILEPGTKLYLNPSESSIVIKSIWQNAVLPIVDQKDAPQTGEDGWYYLAGIGYVPTEAVQPVDYDPQLPDENISRQGSLAVVSVPYTSAYFRPTVTSQSLYRYYYGSTHWVDKLVFDSNGQGWYRVKDDKFPQDERWVIASRLRIFSPDALAPLSPDVPPEEKNILVELNKQTVTAFEYGLPVFSALISSGDEAANIKYQTPTGVFRVGFKRPSQHMLPWDTTFGDYDLPGVPWVCYFTNRAHAFHGAFWHNGFGTPRSHGCVNLRPDDARWIYRWTTPVVQAHDDMEYTESGGTLVEVI
jgi:lipoprotein-anchoring transpeptidase ErfK/SrfK